METQRTRRIGDQIRSEISALLLRGELHDPRIQGLISVTAVKVTSDLGNATVHVTIFGDSDACKNAVDGLNSAAGFIRRHLAKQIRLRRIPELRFAYDPSIREGDHINRILIAENETSPERKG